MKPVVPISVGELIDKITILEIKRENIKDPDKLKNIIIEKELLSNLEQEIIDKHIMGSPQYAMVLKNTYRNIRDELKQVNRILWDIEDQIRSIEKDGTAFNLNVYLIESKPYELHGLELEKAAEFVTLARQVYMKNDGRAAIKRRINNLFNSDIIEEKDYTPY